MSIFPMLIMDRILDFMPQITWYKLKLNKRLRHRILEKVKNLCHKRRPEDLIKRGLIESFKLKTKVRSRCFYLLAYYGYNKTIDWLIHFNRYNCSIQLRNLEIAAGAIRGGRPRIPLGIKVGRNIRKKILMGIDTISVYVEYKTGTYEALMDFVYGDIPLPEAYVDNLVGKSIFKYHRDKISDFYEYIYSNLHAVLEWAAYYGDWNTILRYAKDPYFHEKNWALLAVNAAFGGRTDIMIFALDNCKNLNTDALCIAAASNGRINTLMYLLNENQHVKAAVHMFFPRDEKEKYDVICEVLKKIN